MGSTIEKQSETETELHEAETELATLRKDTPEWLELWFHWHNHCAHEWRIARRGTPDPFAVWMWQKMGGHHFPSRHYFAYDPKKWEVTATLEIEQLQSALERSGCPPAPDEWSPLTMYDPYHYASVELAWLKKFVEGVVAPVVTPPYYSSLTYDLANKLLIIVQMKRAHKMNLSRCEERVRRMKSLARVEAHQRRCARLNSLRKYFPEEARELEENEDLKKINAKLKERLKKCESNMTLDQLEAATPELSGEA